MCFIDFDSHGHVTYLLVMLQTYHFAPFIRSMYGLFYGGVLAIYNDVSLIYVFNMLGISLGLSPIHHVAYYVYMTLYVHQMFTPKLYDTMQVFYGGVLYYTIAIIRSRQFTNY